VLPPVHIIAGLTSIAAGFVALYAIKDSPLHRKSGLVFVFAMLTMASTGAVIALARRAPGTMLVGMLVIYPVGTALLTIRRTAVPSRRLLAGLLLMALAIGRCSVISRGASLRLSCAASIRDRARPSARSRG
jgi:uncharacterized membrane protein